MLPRGSVGWQLASERDRIIWLRRASASQAVHEALLVVPAAAVCDYELDVAKGAQQAAPEW